MRILFKQQVSSVITERTVYDPYHWTRISILINSATFLPYVHIAATVMYGKKAVVKFDYSFLALEKKHSTRQGTLIVFTF